MADRARLTVADHALIHLTGYLCLQPREDATWSALQAELAAVLPHVSRHLPAMNRLAEAALGPTWDDERRDLELVTRLTAGERAADIAEDIGLSLGDLSARFRAICPEPGIEAQRRLIEVLRARTGSHRTEAAE